MSETPEFRAAYWDDRRARDAFRRFLIGIHGLDLGEWDRLGYWDENYIPYSYFIDGEVVSSLCLYSLDAVIDGERCRIAQISGVGTLPPYRRRGWNRMLTDIALKGAFPGHRFAFLFADDEAVPFYRRCGFRPVREYVEIADLPAISPRSGLRRLDVDAEHADIFRHARLRAPVSLAFGHFDPKLVLFHVLKGLRSGVYRIDELDTVLLMERKDDRIVLYDVIAPKLPSFDDLRPFLASGAPERIEFRFRTDAIEAPPTRLEELTGNHPHVWASPALPDPLVFPHTLRA